MTDTAQRMLRIGFDGTPLLGAKTGIGWYTHELIDSLARLSPEDELVVFPISWRTARSLHLDPPHRPNVSVARRIAPARPLWAVWDRVPFPPVEWLVSCDIFHATNYISPPSLRVPTVVTVHDISFVRDPDSVSPAIRRMARLLPTVLRRSSAIITLSNFIRDELSWWLPEVADRIHPIPIGSHRRSGIPGPERRHGAGSTGSDGIPPGPPYALMLGTLEPRKNLPLALDAMKILRDRKVDLRLVLAGGPNALVDVPGLLRERGLGPPTVVRTGYVDDPRVAALVAGARLLVFPSLYEGFGMPLVEAMEAGLPVVAARAAATIETVGDAAVLTDVDDAEGFADAMERVASDEELRARLIGAGHARSARFTWERTAASTLEVYRKLV